LSRKAQNQVRIIGGSHRGRKLEFPDLPGLRPTGDRIRETLFNWLQPVIEGARCLDLFAGSGALGLEAASRGAREVWMLDQAPQAAHLLRQHRELLGLVQVKILQADAMQWLERDPKPFDIVFVDPPFDADLLPMICERLEVKGWLAAAARIYVEDSAGRSFERLPQTWRLLREKRAGQVRYGLAQR
jgi:16S rRNA (guanine966-N2)-methyltransferase